MPRWHRLILSVLALLVSSGVAIAQPVTTPSATAPAGAYNSTPPTCTDGKFCYLQTDANGQLKVIGGIGGPALNGEITSAMTSTTSTALTGMGAQGAGIRVYVTGCTFSNSHATVGTMMLLQDGSEGATLWQAPAASGFGGAQVVFPAPIKTTANTGLFAVNVTTGANTFVSCTGYSGP